jgi:DNA-directed RNA polymerase subunit RPC12/RpoP
MRGQFEAIMKVVCAWCGKDMGEKEPKEDKGTTHSICPQCLSKIKAQRSRYKVGNRKRPKQVIAKRIQQDYSNRHVNR